MDSSDDVDGTVGSTGASNDPVTAVFDAVAGIAPEIRAALPGRRVERGVENPSGESQLAADAYADDLLVDRIGSIDGVAGYASEEAQAVEDVGEGGFHVAVDPLDGSSNLKSNNAMGTIVGVYDEPLPARGTDLVAAGYVLYGPITTMVVARDGRVREEVIHGRGSEPDVDREGADGQREVVNDDVTLSAEPTVYGFGGRVPDWPAPFEAYVREIESELKLRYGGAMVGDVNQVLTYGGIFAYPALESSPEGKLRLQFEGNPVAYVIETAGGASSTGDGSILEVVPADLHQRVPVHVGNAALIDRLEDALA